MAGRIGAAVSYPPSFTCTLCWRTSFHPKDVEHGFCGHCHNYTPGVIAEDSTYQPGRNISYRTASALVHPDGSVTFAAPHVPHDAIEDWEAVLRVAKMESARICRQGPLGLYHEAPGTGPGFQPEGTTHDDHTHTGDDG
jgi:hypothetical protein